MKINAEVGVFLFFGLLAVMLIQQYGVGVSMNSLLPELVLFFAACFWMIFRSIGAGDNEFYTQPHAVKKIALLSLALAAAGSICNTFINYIQYRYDTWLLLPVLLMTFASWFITSFVIFLVVRSFAVRRQKKIDDAMDREEKADDQDEEDLAG